MLLTALNHSPTLKCTPAGMVTACSNVMVTDELLELVWPANRLRPVLGLLMVSAGSPSITLVFDDHWVDEVVSFDGD